MSGRDDAVLNQLFHLKREITIQRYLLPKSTRCCGTFGSNNCHEVLYIKSLQRNLKSLCRIYFSREQNSWQQRYSKVSDSHTDVGFTPDVTTKPSNMLTIVTLEPKIISKCLDDHQYMFGLCIIFDDCGFCCFCLLHLYFWMLFWLLLQSQNLFDDPNCVTKKIQARTNPQEGGHVFHSFVVRSIGKLLLLTWQVSSLSADGFPVAPDRSVPERYSCPPAPACSACFVA